MGKQLAANNEVGEEETILFTLVSSIWAGRADTNAMRDLRNAVIARPQHADGIIQRLCDIRADMTAGRVPRYGVLEEDTIEDIDNAIETIRQVESDLAKGAKPKRKSRLIPVGLP